jgi:predicted protein tyrosine phosphatase
LEITILISIHIVIRWNIQASVALAAMEANDIANVYLSESLCVARRLQPLSPPVKPNIKSLEVHQHRVFSLGKSLVRDVISSQHAMCG